MGDGESRFGVLNVAGESRRDLEINSIKQARRGQNTSESWSGATIANCWVSFPAWGAKVTLWASVASLELWGQSTVKL